jgi:uncharacterized membrane protein YkvA (DUF1232 family)
MAWSYSLGPWSSEWVWFGWARLIDGLKERARALKLETLTLYFAARDPRTPWYAKVIAAGVVAYALSPFDLIPDFIPVLGYLDDLIIVPAGVAFVLRLVPPLVLADCRKRAAHQATRPGSRLGAAFMITLWLAVGLWAILFIRGLVNA